MYHEFSLILVWVEKFRITILDHGNLVY